jgi:hypothetical protein
MALVGGEDVRFSSCFGISKEIPTKNSLYPTPVEWRMPIIYHTNADDRLSIIPSQEYEAI